MLDIKLLREHPEGIQKRLHTKDPNIDIFAILDLDQEIRGKQTEVEELKAKRNSASKVIAEKKQKREDASSILEEMKQIADRITEIDRDLNSLLEERETKILFLPNIPQEGLPISLDPKDNLCIKEGFKRREFAFPFKNHVELNEKLKLFDFARGAKISGSHFPLYTDRGAKLEWALINYMLDIHRKNGYRHIIPPLLVKKEMMKGSAHLPKFENQLFKIKDEDFQLYLVPTAEAALNALHAEEIFDETELPRLYTAYTPCFRREAGAAGTNERGLIRTHQFNKVELFVFCKPQDSDPLFERIVGDAERVVEGLELPYRLMLLATGDTSFASARTIDLEVYLPGQNRYYEVSSISNCTDFQARRSQTRYRNKADEKLQFVHTLNGSGVATSRLMVALLENNQQADGSVLLPKALYPYLEQDMIHLTPLC